jgi:hypothetical protein
VADLIGGRAAWTALGLPTDGQIGDRGRIGQYVHEAPAVDVNATIAEMGAIDAGGVAVAVVGPGHVLLGALQPTAAGLPPATRVIDAMVPAPGTIRSEVRVHDVVEQLRRDGLDHTFVTTVDGRLVGLVITEELHA